MVPRLQRSWTGAVADPRPLQPIVFQQEHGCAVPGQGRPGDPQTGRREMPRTYRPFHGRHEDGRRLHHHLLRLPHHVSLPRRRRGRQRPARMVQIRLLPGRPLARLRGPSSDRFPASRSSRAVSSPECSAASSRCRHGERARGSSRRTGASGATTSVTHRSASRDSSITSSIAISSRP
jgi:hypothetical protein